MAKPVIAWRALVAVTTAGPTYTAAPTWTPAANSLIVAFCVGSAVSPSDPTGVTAHGVTLTKLVLSANSLSTTHFCSIWVGDAGASPTSAAAAATWGGTPTGGAVIEFEVTGWAANDGVTKAFGTEGLIETGTAATGTTGTATANLRPDVTSEHVEMSLWLHLANEVTNPRANWTETAGADGSYNTPATGVEGQFRTDAYELTATATWTTSINWRGYILTVRGTATTPTENVHVVDTVTAQLTPLLVSVASENAKLQDVVLNTPRLLPGTIDGPDRLVETFQIEENVYGADISVVSQNRRTVGFREVELHLSDVLAVNWPVDPELGTPATETVKVSDTNQGVVQLIGVVHVQDTVTAVMGSAGSGDLSRAINDEVLKLAETVTADENPRDISAGTENLKLADTLTAQLTPLLGTPGNEALHVVDGPVIADENPRDVSAGTEVLKLADTLTAARDLTASGFDESLKLSDGPVVADENPRPVLVAQEALHVVDTLTAARDLTASGFDEALKLADGPVLADENPRDVPVAQEVLHVVDTVTTAINPEQVALADEVLHVQDTLTAALVIDISASASESLRVLDFVFGASRFVAAENTLAAGLMENPLKLADTVTAVIQLGVQLADETLHVQDSVTADENPRPVLVAQEVLKLADTVTTSLDPLQTATPAETLKLADGPVIGDENPRPVLVAGETLKLADTVSALRDLSGLPADENVHVVDGPPVGDENPRPVLVGGETLKLADTVTASRGLTAALADETLHVQDAVTAMPDQASASVQDVLKLTDTVTASLDPLQATLQDALRLAESVSAAEDEIVTLAEAAKLSDAITAVLDPLQASAADSLRIADTDLAVDIGATRVTVGPESLRLADQVTAARDLTASVNELTRLRDIAYVNGIPLMAIAFASESLSGDILTAEALSGDIATAEALGTDVFTDEVLEPA